MLIAEIFVSGIKIVSVPRKMSDVLRTGTVNLTLNDSMFL